MKTNRNFTNVLPLLVYALALLLFLLLPILVLADGIGKIAPVEQLTPKELRSAETIRQHERHGALLPFPTYHEWEAIPRPKYWNAYGVDPGAVNKYGRVNWYYYWSEETECYEGYSDVWEGTDHCKQKEEEERKQVAAVPEPDGVVLFGIAICYAWWMLRRQA